MNFCTNTLLRTVVLCSLLTEINAEQTAHQFNVQTSTTMNYLLYKPSEKSKDSDTKPPLLLFLHGGGEGGDDIEQVKKHGPPKLIEQGREFPFFVLSPQNPYTSGFWDDYAVHALLQHVIAEYSVDTNRIYLAGLSRGGYGAWRLLVNYPDQFAAGLVICGASAPEHYAGRVKDIPLWLVHGAKDTVIPVSETIAMKEALVKNGNKPRLTIYPEAGHDSWTATFENEDVYQWLLSQRRRE